MAERSGTRRPTIRDVAERAGVSKSLVSLAFVSPGSVGPERRRRIRAAADELGYRPNHAARSLNGARDDFVGILVADPWNPVHVDVVDAARAELARTGRAGLMTSVVQPTGGIDLDAVAMVADLRPAAVLLVGSVPELDRVTEQLGSARIVIASGRSEHGGTASVRGDDAVGMRLVIDHLVERGHRRIGHVGGGGGPVARDREAAFIAAMEAHGLDPSLRAPSDFSEAAGALAARALLEHADPPTALTALNDLAAIGVLGAVRRAGLVDRVAITGYDATYLATLGPIDLTSVDPRSARIGARAVQLLLDEPQARSETLIAPELRIRSSSAWAQSARTARRPR